MHSKEIQRLFMKILAGMVLIFTPLLINPSKAEDLGTEKSNQKDPPKAPLNQAKPIITVTTPDGRQISSQEDDHEDKKEDEQPTKEPSDSEASESELPDLEITHEAQLRTFNILSGMEKMEPTLQQKPKPQDKKSVPVEEKVVLVLTQKQQRALEKKLPSANMNSNFGWQFQKLPPNISQRLYFDSNSHLPPTVFQYEIDNEAFKLTERSVDLNLLRAILLKMSSINAKDQNGNTLLHHSVYHQNHDAVLLLLHQGADPNSQNHFGTTPIHIVSYINDTLSLSLLLDNDASINIIDQNGMTPIMYATLNAHVYSIKKLMRKGANLDIKDKMGRTVFDIIAQTKHKELSHYLRAPNQAEDQRSIIYNFKKHR